MSRRLSLGEVPSVLSLPSTSISSLQISKHKTEKTPLNSANPLLHPLLFFAIRMSERESIRVHFLLRTHENQPDTFWGPLGGKSSFGQPTVEGWLLFGADWGVEQERWEWASEAACCSEWPPLKRGWLSGSDSAPWICLVFSSHVSHNTRWPQRRAANTASGSADQHN